MLDPAEAAAVAEEFGVSDEQVRRDHLLSHLLAVLAQRLPEAVVFFGGTALARTHLPDRGAPRVRPADLGPSAIRGGGQSRRRCAPMTA